MARISLAMGLAGVSLAPARADGVAHPAARPAGDSGSHAACLGELDRLGVAYKPVERGGIDIAVQVDGDIHGITYRGYRERPLVLDCSLVVSLAQISPYLAAYNIETVTYSSAYQRRKVRGSNRWSKHSFGLAIDVHAFSGADLGTLRVRDDYEQGLGDDVDCLGLPLTEGGAILRALTCQFEHSELFDSVLTPDYDAAHYNHFHLEARPWNERAPTNVSALARPR